MKDIWATVSYRNAINFLGTKTTVIELCNQFGGRVAVCPDWNGRVMTSTCNGLDGGSFGMIDVAAINACPVGQISPLSGGEDQMSLSPQEGPFSLLAPVRLDDQKRGPLEPPELLSPYSDGIFIVDSVPPAPEIRMRRSISVANLAASRFDLDLVRTVRLLGTRDISSIFGDSVAVALEQMDVSCVGFVTTNSLANRGQNHDRSTGLISLMVRSMYNSGADTVAIIPFRKGPKEKLGPTACSDFFGAAPHGRIRTLPDAAILRADGKGRCQIGLSRRRAVSQCASIDFREGVLTLIAFDMPEKPWLHDYVSNDFVEVFNDDSIDFVSIRDYYSGKGGMPWNIALASDDNDFLFSGEVLRAYNHGLIGTEKPLSGQYYGFEVFSPAYELAHGESLTHHQYTLHVNADNRTLEYLVENALGIRYEQIFDKMRT